MAEVSVLVAAYNNAPYIEELLRSVLGGSFRDIEVLVRDDGSDDDTVPRILSAIRKDSRLRLLQNQSGKKSAKSNFFALLAESDSEYTMFCDADDVWLPDKIEKTLEKMRFAEREYPGVPVLVHTDLSVAGRDLQVIAPSLFAYEKLSPERSSLRELLAQNSVTGCTVMINRALRESVRGGEDAVMHDWWLALIASAFGKIEVLYRPTILYRQHGKNAVGAYNAGNPAAAAARFREKDRTKEIYRAMFRQADSFAELYKDKLSAGQYRLAKAYGGMQNLKKTGRIVRIVQYGFYKNTPARNIGQFLMI